MGESGMTKPRLLDLFCGAGGAAMGYHRAGFEVVGVDIKPQPHYPFEFCEGDAMQVLAGLAGYGEEWTEIIDPDISWDVIHASPPCQAFSVATPEAHRASHPDHLTPTRSYLRHIDHLRGHQPYVIENVPGSPIIGSVMLCGSSFGLGIDSHQVRRHRYFETNPQLLLAPPCQHDQRPTIDLAGGGGNTDKSKRRYKGSVAERREASGMDWANRDEIAQAIPPAYTEWIGRQLIATLERAA